MSSWELSRLPPFCRFSSKNIRHARHHAFGLQPGPRDRVTPPAVGDVVHDEVRGVPGIDTPPLEQGFLLLRFRGAGPGPLRRCAPDGGRFVGNAPCHKPFSYSARCRTLLKFAGMGSGFRRSNCPA